MDVLDIVKAKIPEDKRPEDSLLGLFVAEIGQTILTYLNRSDMPSELSFVHANMVIDLITGENRKTEPDGQTSVSSIKEGDVTVQFGSARIEGRERATESLLFDYASQLNRFRKLRR